MSLPSTCINGGNRFLLLVAVLFLGSIFISCIVNVANAGPLGRLEGAVMPGKVIEGHAKYENQCEKCHSPFEKASQNQLCLDCHKEINTDVTNKRGFHGRIPDVKNKPCKVCHTEHKGRNANIVPFDKGTFDHKQTDFELRGAHTQVECGQCHLPKKKYREAAGKCYDCHKEDEPHQGKLGKECDVCHQEKGWKEFFFDHSKTKYPLKGKHQSVACEHCHVNEQYKGVPTVCYSCHKLDDKHEGKNGEKCDKCHTPSGWRSVGFDHNKDTKFKLENKHEQVTCAQCHKENAYTKKLKTDCYSCHQLQDEHKGLYGKKCESCHSTKGWSEIKFDHDKDTKFSLKGKHKDVACRSCHRGDIYKDKLKMDCFSCHRQDDVHNGQEGQKCERCHSEEGWIKEVDFDHGLTKFPLLGVHNSVSCEECHVTSSFKDAKKACLTCHQDDDTHKGKLGEKCEACHNPNDWRTWQFDHDKQTDFKLKGAHEKVHCHDCHNKPVKDKIELPMDCYSCHAKDDVHNGAYGRTCERCHVTSSFGDFELNRQ